MKTPHNIESLFKSKLSNLEHTPSPKAWEKTARALRRKQFFRFNKRRFNVYYLGIIMVAGSLVAVLSPQSAVDSIQSAVDSTQYSVDSSQSAVASTQSTVSSRQLGDISSDESMSEVLGIQTSKIQPQAASITPNSSESDSASTKDFEYEPQRTTNTPIIFFTPSCYEGCAPLEVRFINNSVNAEAFVWNFGQHSKQSENQTILYEEAGTYTVTLSGKDKNGILSSYSEQITVNPSPHATFEIADGEIYNYSSNADEFKWLISQSAGMNSYELISKGFTPKASSLEVQGSYRPSRLLLTASNSWGCTDTSSLAIPKPVSPSLIFPSAFNPNEQGPSGGYYNPNEAGNSVFHPKYNTEPSSYQLKIFNKSGELLFETLEIAIGWDGYHKEVLVPKGVYVYDCRGTWSNGEPFNYRGDLTILHSASR